MKEKIVIIGGGGHAKVLISIIKKNNNFDIIGYTDKHENGVISGIKYLGTDERLNELFDGGVHNAGLGIGQINLSQMRKNIVEKISQMGFKFPSIMSKNAVINEDVKIAQGAQIFDGVVINSGSQIGQFSIINTNTTIEHDCRIGNFTHIAPGVTLSGGVQIGDSTMIGVGATVIQSVTITNDVLVGAGALVLKDILESGKYFGIPVKKM